MKKAVTICLLLISVMGFSQTKITAVKVVDRIDVTINKFFFTSYLFAKNEKYPFFYPVNGPYPAPWFTRDYGFFSPTPLNWPKDDKATSFKKGEKIHLMYRVLVHSGTHETANIAGEFKKFEAENSFNCI